MGLIAAVGEKVGLDGIPGFKLVANVAEGFIDGALLLPPFTAAGLAIIGTKAVTTGALTGDMGGALKEGVMSAGLGLVGAGALRGAATATSGSTGALASTVSGASNAAGRLGNVGTTLASKTDDLLQNGRFAETWTKAANSPATQRMGDLIKKADDAVEAGAAQAVTRAQPTVSAAAAQAQAAATRVGSTVTNTAGSVRAAVPRPTVTGVSETVGRVGTRTVIEAAKGTAHATVAAVRGARQGVSEGLAPKPV